MLGLANTLVGGAPTQAFVDPSSIASLRLWLKYDTGMSTASGETSAAGDIDNGDQIITWADQSGQGNDASNSTAADRPKYNNNGATDGSLEWAGRTKWYNLDSNIAISSNEDFTLVMNVKFNDDAVSSLFGHDSNYFWRRTNASTFRILCSDTSPQTDFTEGSATIGSSSTFGSANYYSVMIVRSNGSTGTLTMYVDNQNNGDDYDNKTWGSAGADPEAVTISNIGAAADDASELKGWVRHVSYYNEALGAADRANIFTYLSNIGS